TRGLDNAAGVAGGRVGESDDVPDLGHLGPRLGARRRAATGEQGAQGARLEGAALSGPPRNPRELGAGALRECGCCRQCSRHGGESLADEDDSAVSERLPRGPSGLRAAEVAQNGGLVAWPSGYQAAGELRETARGERRDRIHLRPVPADSLAQPQEDDG